MSHTFRRQTPAVLSAAVAASLFASGCSSINNTLAGDKVDYRTSGSQSVKLDVPPDLTQLSGQTRYNQYQPSTVTASSMAQSTSKADAAESGDASVAADQVGGLQMMRDGQTRWLAVPMPPEKLWPAVRQFWQDSGFELTTDQADIGLMETNWSENNAKVPQDGVIRKALGRVFDMLYDTGERDRYRTRIERTAKGSEIYITHQGLVEEYEDARKDHTVWRVRPSDPGLESEMLRRLMIKLGAPKEVAAKEVQATQAPAQPAETFATLSDDGLSLSLKGDFDTAWRRVGLALDRSGFTVESRDRKLGAYDIRLAEDDATVNKPGFFARLFGASEGESLKRFRVQVQSQGSMSKVTVLGDNGKPVNSAMAKKIAKQLQDELG